MNIIKIEDLSSPDMALFARLTESQLRNRIEPEKGIFIAENPKVIGLALDAGCEPVAFLTECQYMKGQVQEVIGRCEDTPIYLADGSLLTELIGFKLTRGVLCAMRRPRELSVEKVCTDARRIAVLENIADATNVGAVFRSAAALGIDAVLLTPSCCDPLCRRAIGVSMGTILQVPWARIGSRSSDWPQAGIERLRQMKFKTLAMALCDDAVEIDHPMLSAEKKLAIVLGTEGSGLSHSTVAMCDYTARIPMSHHVDSLNIAAAGAVAFWQLRVR